MGLGYCIRWFIHWTDYLQLKFRARQRFIASLDKNALENSNESPVIVIGMHRSGTSITSKILQELGVSMGFHIGNNFESAHFLHRNMVMFDLANATWDNPGNLAQCFRHKKWLNAFTLVASQGMRNEGRFKCDSHGNPGNHGCWGFKDPRTSFTLPVWLQLYPNAKIINVVRNPSAVCRSLEVRGNYSITQGGGLSLTSLNESMAIDLWTDYVNSINSNLENLDKQQIFNLRYEDLTNKPELWIKRICEFLSLETNQDQVSKIASAVVGNCTIHVDMPVTSKKALKAIKEAGYTVEDSSETPKKNRQKSVPTT